MAETHPFRTDDYGETTWCEFPPIEAALHSLANGLRFGYPLCCVEQFCLDTMAGRHPAMRRGTLPTEGGGVYVPCDRCREAAGPIGWA